MQPWYVNTALPLIVASSVVCADAYASPPTVATQETSAIERDATVVDRDVMAVPRITDSATLAADVLYDLSPLSNVEPAIGQLLRAYQAGRLEQVRKLADNIAARSIDAHVKSASLMLAAMLSEKRRRLVQAEGYWKRLAQRGPLANRARLRLARLAIKRDAVDQALPQLAAVSVWHAQHDQALLKMTELHLDRGRVGPASAVIERVNGRFLTAEGRARQAVLRGDILRRQGRTQRAVRAYLQAWRLSKSPHSDLALERLAALGQPPSRVERIEQKLKQGRRRIPSGKKGRKRRQHLLEEIDVVAEGVPALAWYGRGVMQTWKRAMREQAVETLTRALAAAKSPTVEAHIRFRLGDVLGKLGRDSEAIATIEPVLAVVGDRRIVSKSLWRLHRLYKYTGRTLDAERVLTRVVADGPPREIRDHALWELAWHRFRSGDCNETIRLLVLLEGVAAGTFDDARQPWSARSQYWQARCHAKHGRHQQAMRLWRLVVATHPLTYYGVMSLDRIREVSPELAERLLGRPPPVSGQQRLKIEEFRVQRNPRLDEAVILLRLGWYRKAGRLLHGQLRGGIPRDGVHLLAAIYQMTNRSRMAFRILQRYTSHAARPDVSVVQVWRSAFPVPWLKEFDRAAKATGVSRSYLYAIARHESSFHPKAKSSAGAIGLLQLLPIVARRVAKLYGLRVPSKRSMQRPGVSVGLGARYIAQLSSMFGGNRALVSAGYNAGPYAVRGWLRKQDRIATDVFVESLAYRGARRYVARVEATAQSYAWLYPEWQEGVRLLEGRPALVPARLGPFMRRFKQTTTSAFPKCRMERPRVVADWIR